MNMNINSQPAGGRHVCTGICRICPTTTNTNNRNSIKNTCTRHARSKSKHYQYQHTYAHILNNNTQKRKSSTQLQSSASSSNLSNSSQSSYDHKTNLSIISILTATTLNLLGFTMTSPLTPTIGQHFNIPPSASFGTLTSAYPLGMLFGLYIWPKMSDYHHIGRKKIMVITLFGSTLGLLLQAYCILFTNSITTVAGTGAHHNNIMKMFLVSRVITGIFAGCAPVAKAYLADVGDTNGKLSVYLGWRDAASTLAYILGPGLGGILFQFLMTSSLTSIRSTASGVSTSTTANAAIATATTSSQALGYVISVSALASFIATMLIVSFVHDQPIIQRKLNHEQNNDNNNNDDQHNQNNQHQQHNDYDIMSCPLGTKIWTGVATVCLISFLYHIADSTFFAFFPAYLQSSLQFNPQQIGVVFTLLSSVTFCFSASSISSKLIQAIGVVRTCALGLGLIGIGLSLLSYASASSMLSILTFLSAGIYFCGVPLYGPTIPTMLLQCVPPYQRGTVMGIDGIMNTIARIFAPIFMGGIYKRFGPGLTFQLAGLSVFCSSTLAMIRRWIVMRDQKSNK